MEQHTGTARGHGTSTRLQSTTSFSRFAYRSRSRTEPRRRSTARFGVLAMSDFLSRMTAKRLQRQATGAPPPFTPKPPSVPPPLPGEMPPVTSTPPLLHGDAGTTVYHGSPHDFQEFSTKHIGSGEGAQAFGHGLYYADDKNIADFYKRNLGRQQLVDDYLRVGDEENLLGRVLADAPMDVVGPRLKDPKQVRLLQAL